MSWTLDIQNISSGHEHHARLLGLRIAWPKRSSGVPTDLDENGIRDIALPLGVVDVKVCAVDATWSGLTLVRRLGNR